MSNSWKLDQKGQDLLAKTEKIVKEIVAPAAYENDKHGKYPRPTLNAMKEAGLLGLVIDEKNGGQGQGIRTAMAVAEAIARECPSTAMVTMMHHSGAAVINQFGSDALKDTVAKEGKLTTISFSESGSRSHFWLPVSTATKKGENVELNAKKQMTTSAGEADIYVWSSQPAEAEGFSTIWAVPGNAQGLNIPSPYDGLGLRANSSAPILAEGVTISANDHLGGDGKGFDVMMGTVLPWFNFQNAAVSLGCMEGAFERAVKHVSGAGFKYDGTALRDIPQVRRHVAEMKVKIDMVRGLLLKGIEAVEGGQPDAVLNVLEVKTAAADTAIEVLDIAMRVCGGAAFRKDVSVERYFRDSRAAAVMAPVSDVLYDFIGKACCGMDLF